LLICMKFVVRTTPSAFASALIAQGYPWSPSGVSSHASPPLQCWRGINDNIMEETYLRLP
jgi:hypothetical protein